VLHRPERNLLETTPEHCHRLLIQHPILTNEELSRIKDSTTAAGRPRSSNMVFERAGGEMALRKALDRHLRPDHAGHRGGLQPGDPLRPGDRYGHVALPSLLAVGAVHHHLVKTNSRTRIGIVLKPGRPARITPRMLVGYGADAINPYLAFETLWTCAPAASWTSRMIRRWWKNYTKAVGKGMLKVMSKMGISTLQSYKGAQIFEAIGLNTEVIERRLRGHGL